MGLERSKLGWPRRRQPSDVAVDQNSDLGWPGMSAGTVAALGFDTDPVNPAAADAAASSEQSTPGSQSDASGDQPRHSVLGETQSTAGRGVEITNAGVGNDPSSDPPTTDTVGQCVVEQDAEQGLVEHASEEDSVEQAADHVDEQASERGLVEQAATRDDTVQPPDVSRETSAKVAVELPRPSATRILTVSNQKGGVGKTTTAVNLAVALATQGARVLVIDLDPQGNASTGLGIDHPNGTPSTYNVMVDQASILDTAQPVVAEGVEPGKLLCVPATSDLAGAEVELAAVVIGREFRLKQAVAKFISTTAGDDRFDYVFIDCPPSLGLLTVNALAAAGEVLIPVQCEYYALEGLGQLLETIELIRGYLNPTLHVSTMLLTMFDARTKLAGQVVDEVREHFGDTVMRTIIPRSVKVSEAPSYRQSVMTYDPASRGARAYAATAVEFAERGSRANT